MKSWKTTVTGIIAVLGALAVLLTQGLNYVNGQPVDLVAIKTSVPALVAGVGLMFARDNNVSSEDLGLPKTEDQ